MDAYKNYKASNNPAPENNFYDEDKEEEEINALKKQIRGVKQDSLAATRQALSKINESEAIATSTLTKLGSQSEKINSVERQMDIANKQADMALNKSAELKKINNSMFSIFSFKNPFKNEAKEKEKIERLKQEHEEQIKKEDELRQANYQANERVNSALKNNKPVNHQGSNQGSYKGNANGQYNFEEDEEGMKIEQEIDGNLDLISSTLGNLKNMSLAMSNELDIQNNKLDSINKNATEVQTKVNLGKDRLKTIK
ncbi:hypothetical protein K502DRAFT_310474 [Neoconidiobolus thromboides FSU 785]|nr:hypothetical protein K502DRAFT_310474 [Neoconidiobolus thromboides FSU 785]